ncbi:MAG: hypothetical protein OHK0041_23690 [Anaerolineales bacterium]
MHALDFTEQDLAYNRKGALSPQQTARLTGKRRSFKLMLLVIGVLLSCVGGGVMAALGVQALAKDTTNGIGMLVGAGVFALLGAPLLFLGLKPMRAVKVSTAKGTARVARVQRTRRVNNSTSTYVATELHLAGKVFTVPDEIFPDLEDGAAYAVYYWDGVDEIFSLEKL